MAAGMAEGGKNGGGRGGMALPQILVILRCGHATKIIITHTLREKRNCTNSTKRHGKKIAISFTNFICNGIGKYISIVSIKATKEGTMVLTTEGHTDMAIVTM